MLTQGPGTAGAWKPAEPTRALTAVRGLAAWWVVAYHFREALPRSTPAPVLRVIGSGYLAVDLFFVLSGYVIALNYESWFTGGLRGAAYIRFLALRLSRIYPMHIFMLAMFSLNPLAIWLFSQHGRAGSLHLSYYVASIVLMQSWGFVGGPDWNVPAWSISTEWAAYLTFPLLAAFAAPMTPTPQRSIGYIVVLLAVTSLSLRLFGSSTLNDTDPVPCMIRCLGEVSVGLGVARLEKNRGGGESNQKRWALLGAAAFFSRFMSLSSLSRPPFST